MNLHDKLVTVEFCHYTQHNEPNFHSNTSGVFLSFFVNKYRIQHVIKTKKGWRTFNLVSMFLFKSWPKCSFFRTLDAIFKKPLHKLAFWTFSFKFANLLTQAILIFKLCLMEEAVLNWSIPPTCRWLLCFPRLVHNLEIWTNEADKLSV